MAEHSSGRYIYDTEFVADGLTHYTSFNNSVCYLSLESDGVRLTLGAYAAGPRWVVSASWLNLAARVLQRRKLASATNEKLNSSTDCS